MQSHDSRSVVSMLEGRVEILRLLSVPLTREKQLALQEEFTRYAAASNWVIKAILKSHLRGHSKIREAIKEQFTTEFDRRPTYLYDVIISALAEIGKHNKLAATVRSMRNKIPHFKSGRIILSQPIIAVGERAVTIRLPDRTSISIPYDKRSRNRFASELDSIVKGEPRRVDTTEITAINKRYQRVRFTWHAEGFMDIDIRAVLPTKMD
jgi:hypothetical protein